MMMDHDESHVRLLSHFRNPVFCFSRKEKTGPRDGRTTTTGEVLRNATTSTAITTVARHLLVSASLGEFKYQYQKIPNIQEFA